MLVEEREGRCCLTVQDNGRGGVSAEGLGLRGISERMAAIGGTSACEDHQGVTLTITVPLADQRQRV